MGYQPYFPPWEGYGASPGSHVEARKGQEGEGEQTEQTYQQKLMPDVIAFYDGMAGTTDSGAVRLVCLGFGKGFDVVSHRIMTATLVRSGMGKCTVTWNTG